MTPEAFELLEQHAKVRNNRIIELEDEIERLRAQIGRIDQQRRTVLDENTESRAQVERLKAEIERLRAIIEKLIGLSEYSDPELADALRNSLDNSKE
jgi:chromosome segregation ATPase